VILKIIMRIMALASKAGARYLFFARGVALAPCGVENRTGAYLGLAYGARQPARLAALQ